MILRRRSIPGFVKAVVKGNFVGVVAESEWGAIRAAQALESRGALCRRHFRGPLPTYADRHAEIDPRGNEKGRCGGGTGERFEETGSEL